MGNIESSSEELSHNIDICYDYRHFLKIMHDKSCVIPPEYEYLNDTYHCKPPNKGDTALLTTKFNELTVPQLKSYLFSADNDDYDYDYNITIYCYILDALFIHWHCDKYKYNNGTVVSTTATKRITDPSNDVSHNNTDVDVVADTNRPKNDIKTDNAENVVDSDCPKNDIKTDDAESDNADSNVEMIDILYKICNCAQNSKLSTQITIGDGLISNDCQYLWQFPFHHFLLFMDSHSRLGLELKLVSMINDLSNDLSTVDNDIRMEIVCKMLCINAKHSIKTEHNYTHLRRIFIHFLTQSMQSNRKNCENTQFDFCALLPYIALYRNNSDISIITDILNKGCLHSHWKYGMKAVQNFVDDSFWKYFLDFAARLYRYLSQLNGETLTGIQPNEAAENANAMERQIIPLENAVARQNPISEAEEKKIEGNEGGEEEQSFAAEEERQIDDNSGNNNNSNNGGTVVEYYDIDTQSLFIRTFCEFAIEYPSKYGDLVLGTIHGLLDLRGANGERSGSNNDSCEGKNTADMNHYTESMKYLFRKETFPMRPIMGSILLRIWREYYLISWRCVDTLICDWKNPIAFQSFLLGTHNRIGQNSVIRQLSGNNGVLQLIWKFLSDPHKNSVQCLDLLSDPNNIVWWVSLESIHSQTDNSSDNDDDDDGIDTHCNKQSREMQIRESLATITNVFEMLIFCRVNTRFMIYEQFLKRQNSPINPIIEECIVTRFNSILNLFTLN